SCADRSAGSACYDQPRRPASSTEPEGRAVLTSRLVAEPTGQSTPGLISSRPTIPLAELRTPSSAPPLLPRALCRLEEAFVQVLQPLNHSVDLEIASVTLPSVRTKLPAENVVSQQACHRLGDGIRVAPLDEKGFAPIFEDVWNPANTRRNHGLSGG